MADDDIERPFELDTAFTVIDLGDLPVQADGAAGLGAAANPDRPSASLTCGELLKRIDGNSGKWLILRARKAGKLSFHLTTGRGAAALLGQEKPDQPIANVLKHKFAASMDLYASTDDLMTEPVPVNSLIVDDGIVIGILRSTRPRGAQIATAPMARDELAIISPPTPSHQTLPIQAGTARPHRLQAQLPSSMPLNEDVSLIVSLHRVEGEPLAGDLNLSDGERIDLVVQVSGAIALRGGNTGHVVIGDPSAPPVVQFLIRGIAAGPAVVYVYAFRQRRSLAMLTLTATVTAEDEPAAATHPTPPQTAAASLPRASSRAPDLMLAVIESDDHIDFLLQQNTALPLPIGSIDCRPTRQYFEEFRGLVETLPLNTTDQRWTAKDTIRRWGTDLFRRLLPDDVQKILWEHRGSDRFTIQISSNEAWIPWEVFHLSREVDGETVDGQSLAEAFAITRWIHGTDSPEHLCFDRWAVVIPKDSGLTCADSERDFLMSQRGPGREVKEIEPRYQKLVEALRREKFDAWHFCGHATAGAADQADQSSLQLDNGDRFRASQFAGDITNALQPRPFVFFNACQSAVAGLSLTGIGGWANRLIKGTDVKPGAAAFIGTYWSVDDRAAFAFAKTLYEKLLAGQPIGIAMRDTRRLARDANDGTDPLSWLAYTAYADPMATVSVDGGTR